MTPPDNDVLSFIKDYIWAPFMGLIAWAWNHHTKRVDDLKQYVDKQDNSVREHADEQNNSTRKEVERQRDVSAKIFDKLDEMKTASEDRHREILKGQFEMAQMFHTALSQKADKD